MLIQRDDYLNFLLEWKDRQIIKVISGIRRCGKSTLFELFCAKLRNEGVQSEQIITINFEDAENEELCDYKKLYEYIKSHEINEGIQEEKTQLKNFFFRRIIISIFMNVFSIFLFYYVIVFCSLYRNTQLNWFISGIWCLLIEWVILSPLYILIISIIEKKGRSQKISSYYMKKLFMF